MPVTIKYIWFNPLDLFNRNYLNCTFDFHWLPFISRCAYCTVPYTVIGRLENIDEDLHYIGKMAGVEFGKEHRNKNEGGDTYELAGKYFGLLEKKVVMELFKLYRVDFEMFGYTVDTFLK